MNNMDLQSFYQHALQWKHQKEEAERLADEARTREIQDQWKEIAGMLRSALPVAGMKILETLPGQFREYPDKHYYFFLDCSFSGADPARRGEHDITLAPLAGEIRVLVGWNREAQKPDWHIAKYIVRHEGQAVEFETPYEAFLIAYQTNGDNA